MSNLFAVSTRKKYRFPSVVGELTTEDLWNLPLKSTRSNRADLQGVAGTLHSAIKTEGEVNFVDDTSPANTVLIQKLDIVKFIIATKKNENSSKVNAALNKQHNEKVDAIIERKKTSQMEEMSVEELEALKK